MASSFEHLSDRYLSSLAARSPKTVSTYATGLRHFAAFLLATEAGGLQEWTPQTIGPHALEHFFGWLVREHGREHRSTVATYVAAARGFMRHLARHGELPPTASYEHMRENLREATGPTRYRSPRIDRRLPLIVTFVGGLPVPAPEHRNGASRLEVLRDKALIALLFCSGMRRAEVAGLNRQDVDDGVADRALITGKGEKERVVFLDSETQAAIRAYLEGRADTLAPLFLRHDNRRGRSAGHGGDRWRLSAQSIWAIVKKYSSASGVPASTHHFRHAKASVLLNRGASLSEVQDILGHASPETTKRIYAHYQVQHLRDAFDRFSASAEELVAELPAGYVNRSSRQPAASPKARTPGAAR